MYADMGASHDLLVTGNLEQARGACVAWIQMYPNDVYPRAFLAGMVYPAYGQYDKALEEVRQMMTMDPDFVVGYRNAALSLIVLNRSDEAERVLQQVGVRKVFLPSFVTDAYRIAVLRGDLDGMQKALQTAPTNPRLLSYRASTLAQAGQLEQAQSVQEQAIRAARQAVKPETEAQLVLSSAFTKMFYGYPEQAAKQARVALELSNGRGVESSTALLLAMAGQTGEAALLASDVRMRFSEDTLVRRSWLPSIQAATALREKKPRQALSVLEPTSQFGTSLPLYPAYLRGQAHLGLSDAAQAAADFATVVDHPGLVLNDPLLNLAQINLARAYAARGDREQAKAAYRAVQKRWQDAKDSFPLRDQVDQEARSL